MTLNLRNSVRTSINLGLRQSISGGVDRLGLFRSSSLDLRFADKKTLTDRVSGNNLITFSRASSGTYVDSDGLIKTASADTPRFDHDPLNGESLGLLIEEERTNLLTYSEQFDQWPKGSSAVVTSNTIAAPDGALTADKVYLPSSGTRYIAKSVTLTQDKTYTFSVYAKAVTPGTNNVFLPRIGSPSPKSPSSDFVATSEWQRFVFTFTHTDVTASTNIFPLNINAPYIIDLYLWGSQLEEGAFQSSYIPTAGQSGGVIRTPDVATIEGTNFSSWYNQSEGTVFADARCNGLGGSGAVSFAGHISDGSAINYVDVFRYQPEGKVFITSNSVTQATLIPSSPIQQFHKTALAFKSNSFALSADGSAALTDNVGSIPTGLTTLNIGDDRTNTRSLNGHISRLAYFPTRKTDQELIKITDGTLYAPAITYGITSAGGTFNLRAANTVDYAVDWDSTGGYESSTSNTLAHTYTAGNYDLVVYSDDAYRPHFNNVTADASQITSVVIGPGADLGHTIKNAWYGANNMTSFVCPFDVTSGVTNFNSTWRSTGLTSSPLIDTSSGVDFFAVFLGCSSLTSLQVTDTSNGSDFSNFCNSTPITTFPAFDFSSSTKFLDTWYNCTNLTDFPANMFDTTGTLYPNAFRQAWNYAALSAQSIENILVSLDTNGASGINLGLVGGTNAGKTTWSAAAVTAYDSLIVKGWTIFFNA